jgi:capsular polysaccharide biosynthesis protein
MRLIDYWHIARRRWILISAITLLCVAGAAGYSSMQPTTYQSTSRLYVTMATGTSVNDVYQGGLAAQQRVTSYVNLAASSNVAQRVVDQLGLPMSAGELQGRITASFPPATALLDVTVTDSTAEGAVMLTDAVVSQFRRLIDELETIQTDAAPAARVSVVDPATDPTAINGPNSRRLLGIGLLAGLALGCLAALVKDRMDRTIRTSHELGEILPVPVLAILDVGEPGAIGEARRLRTRLIQAGGGDNGMTVMLTSLSARSQPEVSVMLAKAFADSGRRVVLIDADTTGSGISNDLPVSDSGLADLLRTTSSPIDELSTCADTGISVLALGSVDDQTSDLLASERLTQIVSALRSDFDYVVIDAAPVGSAADALTLSGHCDGTVAVVEMGRSTSPQVLGALATFDQGGSRMVGAVAISKKHVNWLRKIIRRPNSEPLRTRSTDTEPQKEEPAIVLDATADTLEADR